MAYSFGELCFCPLAWALYLAILSNCLVSTDATASSESLFEFFDGLSVFEELDAYFLMHLISTLSLAREEPALLTQRSLTVDTSFLRILMRSFNLK